MKPPYSISTEIINQIATISEKIGEINASHLIKQDPILRKSNRIKTIQSTLEIEGNTLSEEQITAIFENKRVLGPVKEIQEVENAIKVYEVIETLKPHSKRDFLKAHKILMSGLISDAGKYRREGVGIVKGNKVAHMAPPPKMVDELMENLFSYLKSVKEHVLIQSCVFHYEMEFIHPFMDGNGRMGRLWQSIILSNKYQVFEYLPIESVVRNKQQEYYKVLSLCDKAGDSTRFIEFMLSVIDESLTEILSNTRKSLTSLDRLEIARNIFGNEKFSRKQYLLEFKEISAPTASRDLKEAVDKQIVSKSGKQRTTVYEFIN